MLLLRLLAQDGSEPYMPHGMCYLWEQNLVWLHVASDALTTLAYWAIPPFLVYLAYRARREIPADSAFARQRLPYDWMFVAFGIFIVACGATHAMGIWTIWEPRYWLEGGVKAVTALASIATAIALPPLVPRALAVLREARESEVRRVELEEAHETQQELVRRLREAGEAKSRFLANVSHDLRTPLSLVLGPLEEILEDEDLPPEVVERLRTARRNARTLGSQVENLLTVARSDAEGLEADLEPADLAAIVREVADHYVAHARGRGIELEVDAPDSFPAMADRDLLKRALLNLLSNAFKFTPDGGSVRCALSGPTEGYVELVVADSGPGIPEEEGEALFDRFRRGEAGEARADGGTGLGLAIVREVAEVHGGSVHVGRAREGGARVSLRLPARSGGGGRAGPAAGGKGTPALGDDDGSGEPVHPAREGVPAPAAGASEGATVLLVEDDPDMARHLGQLLADEHDVAYAADGGEGLEMALALKPDLVITDIMMPEMDGVELVDALRQRPELAETPVLVLTARAEAELPERMLRKGVQDYLVKPVGAGELRARVDNLLDLSGSRRLLQEALSSKEESLERLARMAARRKRELEEKVEENRVLLQELHHRVKGNLQTITSLLHLQLHDVEDEAARQSLEASRGRVATMGLLHEKLYQSGVPDRVELSAYLRSLVGDVVRSRGAESEVETEFATEPVELPVEDAIACGLIVHELTNNALLHGFEGRGTLRLEVRRRDGDVVLVVADDGPGSGVGEAGGEGSLGFQLVEALAEQLEGRLTRGTDGGTTVEIAFPMVEPGHDATSGAVGA